jgi:hypothetical protein
MCRHFRVAMIAGALATAGVGAHAQDAKPRSAPPTRSEQRQAPPARASGGGERAVPRSAPAPRAEAPRPAPAPAPATTSATASRGDSDRARPASGRDQSRQRTSPPPDRRGSGDGDRAVARRGGSPGPDRATATPVYATPRDRGGRQSFGTATPRRYPPYPGHGGGYYPHWNTWYYPYYPLSYGFFWDPWWGFGYPYGGYGGYPYGGYGYGAGYGYGYGSYGPYPGPTYQIYGGLRLKVKPREAEVFVDGYFAGVVDDFDGAFQQLNLDVGPHRIELRATGYESISFELRTQPDEKITYKGELKRVP